MNRIDVKRGGVAQAITAAFLGLGVGGCSLAIALGELARGRLAGALIGLFLFAVIAVAVGLYLRARTRGTLAYVSDLGIGLRDGREVAWSQVRRITDRHARTRLGHRVVWRTELEVEGHPPIWLIPQHVANFGEVHAFLRARPIPYVDA
ncbi:MAG: hypothetical protein U0234_27535 [Sandaracinus sp.]